MQVKESGGSGGTFQNKRDRYIIFQLQIQEFISVCPAQTGKFFYNLRKYILNIMYVKV